MNFNINYSVKVKLTNFGKKIWFHKDDDFREKLEAMGLFPELPKVDDNGYSEIPLWELMKVFGSYMTTNQSQELPFETEIIIPEDTND